MNKPLHIVCLDAPAPPDYGGAIEMYCKIKALAEHGFAITLHYFNYKKDRHADGLQPYCAQIFAYRRKSFLLSPTFSKPHIVSSRINKQLIERLNADDFPVILEGIHCTGIMPYLKNKERKIVVRLHNDEAIYYQHLAIAESNFFKRSYYAIESKRLRHYQSKLLPNAWYAALSDSDEQYFKKDYGLKQVFVVPAFIPWQQLTSLAGRGSYCLYHGNLAIAENESAARWLIQNIFSKFQIPFVIAGKNISQHLIKDAAAYQNISFNNHPTDVELEALIQHAHIHVLPGFNQTGVKLKLLHALFCGRFCITNNQEPGNSTTLAVAQTPEDYMRILKSFMDKSFTETDRMERQETLRLYNNQVNAEKLSAHL